MPAIERDHARLMDSVYRGQRHFYDLTRKYYLFGRDKLIRELECAPGASILEVACGTGRNLATIGKRWPEAALFGMDISSEMLKTAQARLENRATLARGDATCFDAEALLGRPQFDRIILSYCLSMIPDWRAAFNHSLDLLSPGGSLHVVDFYDCSGMPPLLRMSLRRWLEHFHVEPRVQLLDFAAHVAARRRYKIRTRRGPLGYYKLIRITRPSNRHS